MTVAQLIAHLGLTLGQWVSIFDRYPWMILPVKGSPHDPNAVYDLIDVLDIIDTLSVAGQLPPLVWN